MPVKFLGQDSSFIFQDYLHAGNLLIATCRRTGEIERIREVIETTTTTGDEVGHVLGLKRGRMSMNNLSVFDEYGEETANDEQFRQWFESGTLLYVQALDSKDGEERLIDFYAYIERYRFVRNNNEGANFDVDLVWTQPSSYDIPVLACPVVTVTEGQISVLIEFNGVDGTEYTFTRLDNLEVQTITDAPLEVTFSGLDVDTAYTISLEVSQYGLGTETCADIDFVTLPASVASGFGDDSSTAICDELNPITVYYTGTFGIGTLLYSDAALTTIFDTYDYIKIAGVIYGMTSNEITSNEGGCTPPVTAYSYLVGSGSNPCSMSPIEVFSSASTFGSGMTLYSNVTLSTLYVDDPKVAGYTNAFPTGGALTGTVISEGEVFDFVGGAVGTTTGVIC